MRRIVILDKPGAGKSTLARKLGAKLALPAVHLDAGFYEPGWRSVDRRGRGGLDRETLSFLWTFERIARRNTEHILAHQAPSKLVHQPHGDREVATFLRPASQ